MRTVAIAVLLIAVSACFMGHIAVGSATTVPVSVNDSDETIVIRVLPDGNADVSVIRTVPIETQNQSAAFNKTARTYEKGGGSSFNAVDSLITFKRAARAVGNESNRSMQIVDVANDTARHGNTGIFYRNFTWTNFAVPPESNGVVSLNESFTAGDRPWLPSLTADERLVVSVSQGYELQGGTNVDRVENNAWVFKGPRTFEQFDISYRKQSYQGPNGGGNHWIGNPPVSVPTFVALVVMGSIGLFAYSRRQTLLDRLSDGVTGSPERSETDPPRSTTDHETGTAGAPVMGPVVDSDSDSDSDSDLGSTADPVDVELLSDEERVERLLQNNGGRMRQATIVTETDWSDAKVSQLLSAMDEDNRIEKLRIGRENLISLPNHGPGWDAGSDPDHAGND
ncbi:helix-turn-helix transcriptional regulator [Halocatena salina]|uniref:Transmembrane glycoprotein / HTH domain protein n=1 Tax=Halocatena salina TaxID=2934340 RepID=A0A8T9ZZB5_9EURY|nr:hypothetical protein [Halocatena salina]UPM42095.1 hypothetical protein MW046_08970 [Halocatena salina]